MSESRSAGLRLQKILSQAGVASRRAAEKLIAEGRVTINGRTVREMGVKADAAADDIRVDGRRVKAAERHRYILLNKPAGYVTTRSDPQRRRTVVDLLGGVREYVYPVGRLDYDTEGLLLLTNDGDLAAKLTHPRHGVERTYEAHVAGIPDDAALERLRDGIPLDGRRTLRADVKLLNRAHGPPKGGPYRAPAHGPPKGGPNRAPAHGPPKGGPNRAPAHGPPKGGPNRAPAHGPPTGGPPRRTAHVRRGEPEGVLLITIREGRNRQVRRMCEALGHPVRSLRRTSIGPISDRRLRPGEWRELTAAEVETLKRCAHQPDERRAIRARPAGRRA